MVKINAQQVIVTNGKLVPTMFRHRLKANMDSGPFKKDSITECYIAKYDSGYGVWDVDWSDHNRYKVYSEKELHDTFEEITGG